MELLRLSQRITDLDKKITDEALLIKEAMARSNKEQQFYIETLHQDLEIVEKNRLRRYKEEEAERARLMEDVIRLYEKMKHQEGSNYEFEKKISTINEKVAKIKIIPPLEKRPMSPKAPESAINDYGETSMRGSNLGPLPGFDQSE
jgi:adenylate cyclase